MILKWLIMNHRQGFTCEPEIGYNEDGSTFADVENANVTQGRSTPSGAFELDSYTDERTGEIVYKQVNDPELDGLQTADDQIMESLIELYPEHEEALDYAFRNQPPQVAANYNEALERNDWNTVIPLLEQFIDAYREAQSQPNNDLETLRELQRQEREPEIQMDPEDVYDPSEAEYDQSDDEYEPEEEPEEFTPVTYERMSEDAHIEGDHILGDILELQHKVENGELDSDQMNQLLLQEHDIDSLMEAFERFNAKYQWHDKRNWSQGWLSPMAN